MILHESLLSRVSPLGDLVLVRRHRQEMTHTGFELPRSLQGLQMAMVIAVGRGNLYPLMIDSRCQAWFHRTPEVKLGDIVLYQEGVGQPVRFVKDRFETDANDRHLLIMHEVHILGVLEHE